MSTVQLAEKWADTEEPTLPATGAAASPLDGAAAPGRGYPSPIDEAALHGLAGEIVRMIEPHTEADPAALLFQLLAAFGNIIGREAYMVADGARHCLNLFGVLVGQSSKGRKGPRGIKSQTSWSGLTQTGDAIA